MALPRWQEKEVHQETVTSTTGKALDGKKANLFSFSGKTTLKLSRSFGFEWIPFFPLPSSLN